MSDLIRESHHNYNVNDPYASELEVKIQPESNSESNSESQSDLDSQSNSESESELVIPSRYNNKESYYNNSNYSEYSDHEPDHDHDSDSNSEYESSSDSDSTYNYEVDNNPYPNSSNGLVRVSKNIYTTSIKKGGETKLTHTKILYNNSLIRPTLNTYVAIDNKNSECMIGIGQTVCMDMKLITTLKSMMDIKIKDPVKAVDEIKKKLECNSEKCVYSKIKPKVSPDLVKENNKRFKTMGPFNNTEWLSNLDLDETLSKLDHQFPYYKHINFQMIDFDVHPKTELGTINFMDLYNEGYRQFGCVINTDVRTGAGIHWFCIFINLKEKPYTLEYFNSSGRSIYPAITRLFNDQRNIIGNYLDTPKIVKNSLLHQTESNSECGVYSIYYIWQRLNGVKASVFNERKIDDQEMIDFRKNVFHFE